MKFLKRSKYLSVNDGVLRMLLRWLYEKYLDELYIPYDCEVSVSNIGGKRRGLQIRRTKRPIMGNQERYFDLSESQVIDIGYSHFDKDGKKSDKPIPNY